MSLATHGAIGAIVASKFPNHPILAFCLAFASHFILDMIPHWDYHLKTTSKSDSDPLSRELPMGRDLVIDLFKAVLDFLIGLTVSLLLLASFNNIYTVLLILIGVAGGVMPDFLQLVYRLVDRKPSRYEMVFLSTSVVVLQTVYYTV